MGGNANEKPQEKSASGKWGSRRVRTLHPGGHAGQVGRRRKVRHPWWLMKLKESPYGTASTAVLVVGGFMLMLFFIHVGAMPNVDLASAASIFVAVAMMGGLFLSSMAFTSIAIPAGIGFMVRDHPVRENKRALGLLLVSVAIFCVLFFVYFGLDSRKSDKDGFLNSCLVCLAVGGVLVWVVLVAWALRSSFVGRVAAGDGGVVRGANDDEALVGWLIGVVVFLLTVPIWGFFSVLIPFTYLFVFRTVEFSSVMDFGLYLGLWIFLCMITGAIVLEIVARGRWRSRESSATGKLWFPVVMCLSCCLLFYVLFLPYYAADIALIPRVAVRSLGLGEAPVSVFLSENGCASMNAYSGGREVCRFDERRKTGLVCPVFLKSRIGSPFFFELTSFRSDGGWPVRQTVKFEIFPDEKDSDQVGSGDKKSVEPAAPLRYDRIAIPEKDVLSWHVIEPLSKIRDPEKDNPESGTGDATDPGEEGGLLAGLDKKIRPASGPEPDEKPENHASVGIRHVVSYLHQGPLSPDVMERLKPQAKHLVEEQLKWLRRVCGPAPADAAGKQTPEGGRNAARSALLTAMKAERP